MDPTWFQNGTSIKVKIIEYLVFISLNLISVDFTFLILDLF